MRATQCAPAAQAPGAETRTSESPPSTPPQLLIEIDPELFFLQTKAIERPVPKPPPRLATQPSPPASPQPKNVPTRFPNPPWGRIIVEHHTPVGLLLSMGYGAKRDRHTNTPSAHAYSSRCWLPHLHFWSPGRRRRVRSPFRCTPNDCMFSPIFFSTMCVFYIPPPRPFFRTIALVYTKHPQVKSHTGMGPERENTHTQ